MDDVEVEYLCLNSKFQEGTVLFLFYSGNYLTLPAKPVMGLIMMTCGVALGTWPVSILPPYNYQLSMILQLFN